MPADKLRKVSATGAVPNVASVATGGRAPGIATMVVNAGGLTGWTTATSVDFTTYHLVDGVVTDKTDWTGRANPGTNTISEMEVTSGTDIGNSANDIVVCVETAAWVDDLVSTLLQLFNLDGTKKADSIVSSMIIASAISTVKLADLAVTIPKIAITARQQSLDIDGATEIVFSTAATAPAAIPGKTIIWFAP